MAVEPMGEITHWSKMKFNITKVHDCGELVIYFDDMTKTWYTIDEYVDEYKYCSMCGVKL